MIRILIVDDDKGCLDSLKETLELEGYKSIMVASTGREAMGLISGYKFDLILCDITMAGITGYNIIDEVKNKYKDTKFVFVTALASQNNELVGRRMGADEYITKPYSIDKILSTIKKLTGANED